MGNDSLKLSPGSVNKEIIDKIKFDASRSVPSFLVSTDINQKVTKESSGKKVVTKARQIKAPK